VSGFEADGRYDAGVIGKLPHLDANAPGIAGFEAGEAEFGVRRNQVVADGGLVAEKGVIDHDADAMASHILGTGVTFAIAIEAG